MTDFTEDLAKRAKELASLMPTNMSNNDPNIKPANDKNPFSNIIDKLEHSSDIIDTMQKENVLKEGAKFVEDLSQLSANLRTGNYLGAIMEAQELATDIGELYKDGESLKQAVEKDYGKIKNIYEDLSKKAGDITQHIKEDAQQIYGDVKDAYSNVVETAQEVWGATQKLVEDIGQGIKNKDFGEITKGFENFAQTIQNGEIKQHIDKVLEDAKDVKSVVDKDVAAGKNAIDEASHILSNLKGNEEPKIDNSKNKTPEEVARDLKESGIGGLQETKPGQVDSGQVIGGNKTQEAGGHAK